MHRLNGRVLALALLVLALVSAAPAARAIDPIEPGRTGSLTIRSVAGTSFTLYRVAEMTGFGTFTPTWDFADLCSAEDLEGLDSEGWSTLAGTLSGYVGAGGRAYRRADAGEDGSAVFAGLSVGLYLVTGTPYMQDGRMYMPQPSLVALPSRDARDNWVYGLTVDPKPEEVRHYDEIRVRKVWVDGQSADRPEQITVRLYVNDRLYDTVTLSAKNGWRYTWDVRGIAQPAVFKVTEVGVPEGYTHSVDYTGTYITSCRGPGREITIVNRKRGVRPPRPSGKLPQTGLLWWPVPLLAGAGLVLFILGWLRRRRHG